MRLLGVPAEANVSRFTGPVLRPQLQVQSDAPGNMHRTAMRTDLLARVSPFISRLWRRIAHPPCADASRPNGQNVSPLESCGRTRN